MKPGKVEIIHIPHSKEWHTFLKPFPKAKGRFQRLYKIINSNLIYSRFGLNLHPAWASHRSLRLSELADLSGCGWPLSSPPVAAWSRSASPASRRRSVVISYFRAEIWCCRNLSGSTSINVSGSLIISDEIDPILSFNLNRFIAIY